jgi:membrane-bound serine protease (ClpP class)
MERMRRSVSVSLALIALALWPVAARAADASPSPTASASPSPITVLKVEGAIDRPLDGYLEQRLDQAEAAGATVVLQLDTAGTLNQDGVALADRVAGMRVPVLAWVGPVPAKASGAGLLLMYASSLAGVSPGSQTGPLNPVDLAHPDQVYPGLNDTIQGWLDTRGKDTQIDWQDRPLDGADAMSYGIAQDAAASLPEFLDHVDGTTVEAGGTTVTLHTHIATSEGQPSVSIRFDNMGPVKRVAHGVASPSMIYFLLVIGLAALAFELTQPGFGFAGFSGVGMLALAAYGIWVIPPFWPGLLLLLLGVGMMAADVRIRRLGVLTGVGLVSFAVGSFLAWHQVAPAIRISPWLIGGAIVASFLYYGFALTVALQSRDRIVNTQQGLIGLVGQARGRLAPEGPVFVKGAMWRGRSTSDTAIDPGTPVRVRGVDGLVLRVEAEPDAPIEGLEPASTSGD